MELFFSDSCWMVGRCDSNRFCHQKCPMIWACPTWTQSVTLNVLLVLKETQLEERNVLEKNKCLEENFFFCKHTMYFLVVHLYSHLYVVVVPRTRVWLCLNFDQVCCCFFDLHRPSRAKPPTPSTTTTTTPPHHTWITCTAQYTVRCI